MRVAFFVVAALAGLAGCPSAVRPCADNRDCRAGEVCRDNGSGGACLPVQDAGLLGSDAGTDIVDAGPIQDDAGAADAGIVVVDAGAPDAGFVDAGGLTLRGSIEAAAGISSGNGTSLRTNLISTPPSSTVRGGSLTIERQQ